MIEAKSLGERTFDAFNISVLLFLMAITLYPFLYVSFASFSDGGELMKHSGILIKPLDFNIEAYKVVLKNPMILKGYRNTLFYVFVGTAVNLLFTCLGAYVLSRKNVYWKKPIMFMCVLTMFFDGGLIPYYLAVKSLGFYNTVWALIFPTAINTYNLIILRTSFMQIPDSMEESAKMDGANDFTVLFRIILPLSKAVMAVMILFYGVHHWNSWFQAMIFLRERTLYPLVLILREILITNTSQDFIGAASDNNIYAIAEVIKYATIMVATVPILCVYPALQKYFVSGVMIGALKE